MELVREPDAEAAAIAVADLLAISMASALASDGVAHLVITGGTTPLRVYELLGERVEDWARVHLWYGDERCLPLDDPESNHGAAAARLVAPAAIWHPMPATAGPADGPPRYAAELTTDAPADPASGLPVLDVALLGLGPDGHVCSLFPNHPLLDAADPVAGLSDSPKPPPERITLTLPVLALVRRLVLLVTGEAKAAPLAAVLAGTPRRSVPATLLPAERLVVVADAAALGG